MVERGKALAYNIDFDRRKPVNEPYIKKQVETHIGERLNVILSKTKYEIRQGIVFGEGGSEPFIDVLKRGRDYRRQNGSEIDWVREDAEVAGFLKIQEILGNPGTEIGTMMLSIFPQGKKKSSYQHNFYDIFTLNQDQDGPFIEARRYSSALTREEYAKFLGLDFTPDNSHFLSNPVKVDGLEFKNPDDIHKHLHRDHDYTSEEDYKKIKETCAVLILGYIGALANEDKAEQILYFNAILNKVDQSNLGIKAGKEIFAEILTKEQVFYLGNLPVRQTMTGCGSSGGFSLEKGSSNSAFSLAEFGQDKYGSRTFECPQCGKKNIRPENQLVKSCQHCGSSKVAC